MTIYYILDYINNKKLNVFSQVLRPIPNSLTQSIRTFAKSLETWLSSALEFTPDGLSTKKVLGRYITFTPSLYYIF